MTKKRIMKENKMTTPHDLLIVEDKEEVEGLAYLGNEAKTLGFSPRIQTRPARFPNPRDFSHT